MLVVTGADHLCLPLVGSLGLVHAQARPLPLLTPHGRLRAPALTCQFGRARVLGWKLFTLSSEGIPAPALVLGENPGPLTVPQPGFHIHRADLTASSAPGAPRAALGPAALASGPSKVLSS